MKELVFQVIIHVVVFVFYSYDRNDPGIELHQVVFFGVYACAALIVNYILLPAFFYKKKYINFVISTVFLAFAVMFIEEYVLEKIFFPDTRGQLFLGVLSTLLDVVPPIFILSAFKFAWDAVSKQRELEALQSAIRESELQFLKSQINPHFLFNNLNNLYSYTLDKSPKAPEIILKLSEVLRYMLYECKERFVPLKKEISQLDNFTQLNELQIENRGEVQFRTSGVNGTYQIAPLILVVFIENAFKHSQSSMSEGIKINIDVHLTPSGVLNFTCINNYQSEGNTKKLDHGIGLENVKKRLELIYGGRYMLKIHEEADQYVVDLTLDLNDKELVEK